METRTRRSVRQVQSSYNLTSWQARHGTVWLGLAWQGQVRFGRYGRARQGKVRLGVVRFGRYGVAWHGRARLGQVWQVWIYQNY